LLSTNLREFIMGLEQRQKIPEEKDIILVHATETTDLSKILRDVGRRCVPALVKGYVTKDHSMSTGSRTRDIMDFLQYQSLQGLPSPTLQVLGTPKLTHDQSYDALIAYFRQSPKQRDRIINLLDNPLEPDFNLAKFFRIPEPIENCDILQKGLLRPAESHEIRNGFKLPSVLRWALVSSKYSVTGFHWDSNGFYTAFEGQVGTKEWFWVPWSEKNTSILNKHPNFVRT
jgi:hypothetical protein